MYRIKICGITKISDAQMAVLAGADALGLNFYPDSKRCIDPETAEKIVSVLGQRATMIGVFVNAPVEEVQTIAQKLKLDVIQLHGDEPPEMLDEFPDVAIVRAFRFGERGVEEISQYLDACRSNGKSPDAILVDACLPEQYGGTGETADWLAVQKLHEFLDGIPLILAGGLTPFNVGEAIATTRPAAVDVASGVESKAGGKDPLLVRAFVNTAQKAFAALDEPA